MTPEQYALERTLVDRATARWRQIAGKRNWLSAEEAKHPELTACDNAMRGRVEQYEVLRDIPARVLAYLSGDGRTVTTWAGDWLGVVIRVGSREWRPSLHSDKRRYYRVRIGAQHYIGHGAGPGTCISLRAVQST
jgi:hypothetical protein